MNTKPVLDPFVALLKSRAFILMIVTAFVSAIIALIPELEPMRDELINVIVGLALALIGKMALEDSAAKWGAARVEKDSPLTKQ